MAWPADTLGGAKNSGVAQLIKQTDGTIGYVDLADATTVARAVWHSVRGNARFPHEEFRPNKDDDD